MDLFLLMLAGGALIGMVAAIVGLTGPLQVVLASVAAVAALALVRPTIAKKLQGGPTCPSATASWSASRAWSPSGSRDGAGPDQAGRRVLPPSPTTKQWSSSPAGTVDVLQIRGATAIVHPLPGNRVLKEA